MVGSLPAPIWFRLAVLAVVAGTVGTVGGMIGFFLIFVLAQAILTNPAYQSRNMLVVLASLEPLPRIGASDRMLLLVAGVAIFLVLSDRLSRPNTNRPWRHRGLRLGALAWLLMAP